VADREIDAHDWQVVQALGDLRFAYTQGFYAGLWAVYRAIGCIEAPNKAPALLDVPAIPEPRLPIDETSGA
jgi:hypothetical protein